MITAKSTIKYPDSQERPWYQIPLGVSENGEEVWDLSLSHPNAVVVGGAGSGKSVLERVILQHASQHPDEIKVYGIDLSKVEFSHQSYLGMTKIASTYEEAHELIHEVHIVMKQRFERMKEAGVDHIDKLPGKEPAILVMFDESSHVLEKINGTSPEAKETQAMQEEMIDKVKSIARLGRAAKIHLVLCTQRALFPFNDAEAKANFQFRVLLGNSDKIVSNTVLYSDEGTTVDSYGKGVIFRNGQLTDYQTYFTELEHHNNTKKSKPNHDFYSEIFN